MVWQIHHEEILEALELALASDGLANAPKLQRFLRYIVEQTLSGHEAQIKEVVIGVDVYEKPPSYDPRLDATVRVEASKLRHRLGQFYETTGTDSRIQISIPKGSYIPRFARREPAAKDQPAIPSPATAVSQVIPDEQPKETAEPRLVMASLALLLGLVLGWAANFLFVKNTAPAIVGRLTQLSDFTQFSTDPAISPDGSYVVYASEADGPGSLNLWRRNLTGDRSNTQLTKLSQASRSPTISADGKEVAFRLEADGGVLAVMPSAGGSYRLINSGRRARDPRFAPRDRRLAFWVAEDEQTLDRGTVYMLDLADTSVAPARIFGGFAHAAYPVWSSGGAHLIVTGTWQSGPAEKEYDAWTILIDGGTPRKTGLFPLLRGLGVYRNVPERARIRIGDWRDGRLYYSAPAGQGESLFRVRLDENGTISGNPEPVTSGAGSDRGVRAGPENRVVFVNSLNSYALYNAPIRAGQSEEVRRVTHEVGINLRASVDRAGRRAGWERPQPSSSQSQLWLADLATGSGREIGVSTGAQKAFVLVSPDGRRAAYQVLEGRNIAIYLEDFAGGGKPRRICDDCGSPTGWNDAGTHILYTTGTRLNGIGLLEVATGEHHTLLNHPSYGLHGARFLVDARGNGWMALYADTGTRTRQVFAVPVKAFGTAAYQDWIAVTDGAHWDLSPAWAPDGRAIFFVSQRDGHSCIWAQALDPNSHRPQGDPAPVHHFHSPGRSLMESIRNRGADTLWVAGGRIFFSLDNTASSLWLKE